MIYQCSPAAITEARGDVFLGDAAGGTVASDFEVGAAGGTEIRTHYVRCAAGAAASRQRWYVAARFARDVIFDYLPRVLRKFVLPVCAERRQRQQRRKDERDAHGSDCGFVEPLLHSDLYPRAARLRRDLDRQAEDKPVRSRKVLDFRA